jgi:DNA-binding NtrC family response regulator
VAAVLRAAEPDSGGDAGESEVPAVKATHVLIAAGAAPCWAGLRTLLLRHGYEVLVTGDRVGLEGVLRAFAPAVTIVGESTEGAGDEIETALAIRRHDPRAAIVVVVRQSSEDRAITALRARVDDYLRQPVPAAEMAAAIARLAPPAPPALGSGVMVGASAAMREMRDYLARVADTDTNVLVTGETGTGKELVARLIHGGSRRHRGAFVPVNCAALPEGLLETELFGHERGAFTGAHSGRPGALAAAHGGTVFLDEVGDMSLLGQAKILRAIETREVQRVGGRRGMAVDVRVIAATNHDLERAVADRTFRSDLYFRLNVARIHLPPLRERRDDIPLLLAHHVRDLNRRFGRHVEGPTPEVSAVLAGYDWPGNVRELRNVLEACFVTVRSGRIGYADLPERFRRALRLAPVRTPDERTRVLSALAAANWNKSLAARQLQWSRMTLYRKIAKYRLVRSSSAPPA